MKLPRGIFHLRGLVFYCILAPEFISSFSIHIQPQGWLFRRNKMTLTIKYFLSHRYLYFHPVSSQAAVLWWWIVSASAWRAWGRHRPTPPSQAALGQYPERDNLFKLDILRAFWRYNFDCNASTKIFEQIWGNFTSKRLLQLFVENVQHLNVSWSKDNENMTFGSWSGCIFFAETDSRSLTTYHCKTGSLFPSYNQSMIRLWFPALTWEKSNWIRIRN